MCRLLQRQRSTVVLILIVFLASAIDSCESISTPKNYHSIKDQNSTTSIEDASSDDDWIDPKKKKKRGYETSVPTAAPTQSQSFSTSLTNSSTTVPPSMQKDLADSSTAPSSMQNELMDSSTLSPSMENESSTPPLTTTDEMTVLLTPAFTLYFQTQTSTKFSEESLSTIVTTVEQYLNDYLKMIEEHKPLISNEWSFQSCSLSVSKQSILSSRRRNQATDHHQRFLLSARRRDVMETYASNQKEGGCIEIIFSGTFSFHSEASQNSEQPSNSFDASSVPSDTTSLLHRWTIRAFDDTDNNKVLALNLQDHDELSSIQFLSLTPSNSDFLIKSPTPSSSEANSSSPKGKILVTIICLMLLISIMCFTVMFLVHRRRRTNQKTPADVLMSYTGSFSSNSSGSSNGSDDDEEDDNDISVSSPTEQERVESQQHPVTLESSSKSNTSQRNQPAKRKLRKKSKTKTTPYRLASFSERLSTISEGDDDGTSESGGSSCSFVSDDDVDDPLDTQELGTTNVVGLDAPALSSIDGNYYNQSSLATIHHNNTYNASLHDTRTAASTNNDINSCEQAIVNKDDEHCLFESNKNREISLQEEYDEVLVIAPPGRIDLFIDSPTEGEPCVVHKVKRNSALYNKVMVGDLIVKLDEVDVSTWSAVKVSMFLSSRANNPQRSVTIHRQKIYNRNMDTSASNSSIDPRFVQNPNNTPSLNIMESNPTHHHHQFCQPSFFSKMRQSIGRDNNKMVNHGDSFNDEDIDDNYSGIHSETSTDLGSDIIIDAVD